MSVCLSSEWRSYTYSKLYYRELITEREVLSSYTFNPSRVPPASPPIFFPSSFIYLSQCLCVCCLNSVHIPTVSYIIENRQPRGNFSLPTLLTLSYSSPLSLPTFYHPFCFYSFNYLSKYLCVCRLTCVHVGLP